MRFCLQCNSVVSEGWARNCPDIFCAALESDKLSEEEIESSNTMKTSFERESKKVKRNRVINELEQIYKDIWGERCSSHEAGCMRCAAWATFDWASSMTDSSYLD